VLAHRVSLLRAPITPRLLAGARALSGMNSTTTSRSDRESNSGV
jgi:hypothetical protein